MVLLKIDSADIANITLFTTLALCIITGIYTFITYKIQRDQKRNFEIANRPYLTLNTFSIALILDNQNKLIGLQPKLMLKNVGKSILNFKVVSINCTVNGVICDAHNYLNKGSYIFPDSIIEFRYGSITNLTPLNITGKNEGIFSYKVTYTTPGSESGFHSYKKFQFLFSNTVGSSVDYTFIEEEES